MAPGTRESTVTLKIDFNRRPWRTIRIMFNKLTFFLCVLVLAATTVARSEEGFWPYNMVPRDAIEKKYGVTLPDAWLEKVRLSSLRFNNGGSGSFVSPNGLVMTNHHVASEIMQALSTPENDIVKKGFLARTPGEELKAPTLELNQLISIEDVTARIKATIQPGANSTDASRARSAVIAAIEKESLEKTGLRSDVVTLFRGAEYHLYRFKKFTDIRLVFAPEVAIGFFGGDPDNFNFPRYDLDVAFFRVYENGKPFETPNWFTWSKTGAKAGDLTIVSGNPGGTRRLNAVSDLEFSRDFALPLELKWMTRNAELLHQYAGLSAEQARNSQEDIFGLENSLKDMIGQLDGLKNPAVMAKKRETEAALIRNADPALSKQLLDAYASIGHARDGFKSYYAEFKLLEEGVGFNSDLFGTALRLVRLAHERTVPDGKRLAEYNEARLEPLEMQLFSPAPISAQFEKMKLARSFDLLIEELGPNHPAVKLALEGKKPDVRAAELIDGTKLLDVEERKKIAAGGIKAIQTSADPMIMLARLIDPLARALRKRYHNELETVETQAYDLIANVWKESGGVRRYPDGTFTPRISFGTIKGYEEHGKWLEPFTVLNGIYDRSAEHENKEPYILPPSWMSKKAVLNLQTPFNFVSTNDIIGGNSGSPVINSSAEVVGLIFDGNIYSLIGDFYYDETTNRAVAVDCRAIIETLAKVYGADNVVKELTRP